MLYSLKEEIGHQDEIEERRDRDQKTKAQIKIKKKKLRDNTIILTPCPHPHPNMNQPCPPPPHLSHRPIIHNNNILDTEFLVQMRQSNQCGSIRNDEIFNLHLGSGLWALESVSPAFCKTPATLIQSAQTNSQKKIKTTEMRFNS